MRRYTVLILAVVRQPHRTTLPADGSMPAFMKTNMIDTWKLLMCGHLVGFSTVAKLQTLLPLAMVTHVGAVLIDHVLAPFYELTDDDELVASKHTHAKRQARAR
jgi:hypothetical protein